MGSTVSSAWWRLHQPRVYLTVEPVLFAFMFASFLSYSVFQELLHHLVWRQQLLRAGNLSAEEGAHGHYHGGGSSSCEGEPSRLEQEVQSRTSHWLLYVNLASGLPSIAVSLFYGSLSDRIGRKPFILLPAVGTILNQNVVVLVLHYRDSLPLSVLLLGAAISGVCGSYSVVNFAVFSYVSDISVQAKRTLRISLLEGMTYLGATCSLLVGGVWVKSGHFSDPLLCVIAINVAIILYVVVALPETVGSVQREGLFQREGSFQEEGESRREPQTLRMSIKLCQLLLASLRSLLAFGRLLLGSWRVALLMVIFFAVEINFLGITDTIILFSLGQPLCWGSQLVGYFLAAQVFLYGVAALLVLPVLVFLGVRDEVVLVTGLLAGGAALILLGSATRTWMMFIGEYSVGGHCSAHLTSTSVLLTSTPCLTHCSLICIYISTSELNSITTTLQHVNFIATAL